MNKDYSKSAPRGFSLVEMLLVAATIPILIMIAVTAINPAKRLAEARNIERLSNIQAIVNAVYQYSIKNEGHFPISIDTIDKEICRYQVDENTCVAAGGVYLGELTAQSNKYLPTIPYDPSGEKCDLPESIGTCYYIKFSSEENSLYISAPKSELEAKISISY